MCKFVPEKGGKMTQKQVVSGDGSHTFYSMRFNEHYHSMFGAVQESEHIFIRYGLAAVAAQTGRINLFEVGFGTGLNALLSYRYTMKNGLTINYKAVEPYPVMLEEAEKLNYPEILKLERDPFLKMHTVKNESLKIDSRFTLTVETKKLSEISLENGSVHLVYFDAFSPDVQPEMWEESCFELLYCAMQRGAVMVTYSTKGTVKRAIKHAGFIIEKLPGPPGKREVLRAVKL